MFWDQKVTEVSTSKLLTFTVGVIICYFTAVYLYCLLISYCFYRSLVNKDFQICEKMVRFRDIFGKFSPKFCGHCGTKINVKSNDP